MNNYSNLLTSIFVLLLTVQVKSFLNTKFLTGEIRKQREANTLSRPARKHLTTDTFPTDEQADPTQWIVSTSSSLIPSQKTNTPPPFPGPTF